MTDQQLLDAGERLYKAFLGSNFTFLELAGLAAARERWTSWSDLGQNLKLAVFRLVVLSEPELSTASTNDPAVPAQPMEAEQVAPAAGGPDDQVSGERRIGPTAMSTTESSSASTGDPTPISGEDPVDL